MNARNKVEILLTAQRNLELQTLQCCMALAKILDHHRDLSGIIIGIEENSPELMASWTEALLAGRSAIAARHAAVQALGEACKAIGTEPLEDPQGG